MYIYLHNYINCWWNLVNDDLNYGILVQILRTWFHQMRISSGSNRKKHGFAVMNVLLVGGLEHFLFFHILKIIIPIDEYFSEGMKPPTRLSCFQCWNATYSKRIFTGWDGDIFGQFLDRCPYHWTIPIGLFNIAIEAMAHRNRWFTY